MTSTFYFALLIKWQCARLNNKLTKHRNSASPQGKLIKKSEWKEIKGIKEYIKVDK